MLVIMRWLMVSRSSHIRSTTLSAAATVMLRILGDLSRVTANDAYNSVDENYMGLVADPRL